MAWFSNFGAGSAPSAGANAQGASDPNMGWGPPPPRPPTMQESIHMLIDAMGSTMMNTNQQLGYLAQTLGDRDGNQGYRALKPKKEMTRAVSYTHLTLPTKA